MSHISEWFDTGVGGRSLSEDSNNFYVRLRGVALS